MNASVTIYRTDELGTIIASIDGTLIIIPEFTQSIILPILMTTMLLVVIGYKRKHLPRQKN